jgi:predicted O-methyltransferase YrrM
MIPYIGDLSTNDAKVLKIMAENSKSILEFGVGASTQVLRHYSTGPMVSVETMQEWIDRTRANFKLVEVNGEVDFRKYNEDIKGRYDFIFVDGHKRLRKEFALRTWRYLRYGGAMAFHDTRKDFHIDYVGDIIKEYFRQIEQIVVNYMDSNITVMRKCKERKYENWNQTESRPSWQYGRGEFDLEQFNEYKLKQSQKL